MYLSICAFSLSLSLFLSLSLSLSAPELHSDHRGIPLQTARGDQLPAPTFCHPVSEGIAQSPDGGVWKAFEPTTRLSPDADVQSSPQEWGEE